MGYTRHDAIVVTTWKDEAIIDASAKARELGLDVLGPGEPVTNGYRTLLICPDGSKEGWEESNRCEAARATFIDYLKSAHYVDGSSWFSWVAVSYSSDDQDARITAHAWADITPSAAAPRS